MPRRSPPAGFVGRRPDQIKLRSELQRAADGHGRIVVISGEAGIGKTWLVRQVLADLVSPIEASRVRWARCSDAAGAPAYWPWRELLAADFTLENAVSGDSIDPLDRFEQLHAAAHRVREACRSGPLALVIDDLQWADPESVLLLDTLAGDIDELPLIVIATLRDGERTSSSSSEIAALFRHKEVQGIALEGLDADDTAALVTARVGASANAEDLRALRVVTGGNPYFLDELVRGRAADELRGLADPASSPHMAKNLTDQLARRIAALDPDTRVVLKWSAVLDTSFSWGRLVRFAEGTPDARSFTSAALERAIAARLIEPDERAGHYRFVHPLVPAAVLRDLPRLELAGLHGRAGEGLAEEKAAETESAASLARHFAKAALLPEFVEPAVRHCVRAGYEAALGNAHAAAATHYRTALDLLDGSGTGTKVAPYGRPELLLALGQRVALLSPPDAEELLSRAERLADQLAASEAQRAARLAALALVIRCEELPPMTPTGCRRTFERAERAVERLEASDGVLRARLLAAMTPLLRFESSSGESKRIASDAMRIAEATEDTIAKARALEAVHWTRFDEAHDEERLSAASRILRSAEAEGDARLAASARGWRYIDLLEFGRTDEAEAELQLIEAAAAEYAEPRRRYEAVCMRAGMSLHRGQLDAATSLTHEAFELGRRIGIPDDVNACLATLTCIAIERDEPVPFPATARTDEGADSVHSRSGSSYRRFLGGRPTAASNNLATVMQLGLDAIPRGPDRLATLHTLAWAATAIGDRKACAALYAELEPCSSRFVVYQLGAATGSLQRLLMELAVRLGRDREAEAHFRAALAHAQQAEAWCEWAKLQLDHAQRRVAMGADVNAREVRAELLAALKPAREQGWKRTERGVLDLCPELHEVVGGSRRERPPISGTLLRGERDWMVGLGRDTREVGHLLGLEFIAALLGRPGREVLATDLLREVTGDAEESIERARLRITARVRSALVRIDDAHSELARHLRQSLRTGKRCGYFPPPDDAVDWILEDR